MSHLVTVYTLPHCPHCERTKDLLEALDVKFTTVDLSEDADARLKVKEHWGFTSAPVVDTPWDRWSGFNANKIKETARDIEAEAPFYDGK